MSSVGRSALVSHSAQQMFALVSEIESYPEFLPWCDRASIAERRQGRTVATLRINFRGLKEEWNDLAGRMDRPGDPAHGD